MPSSVNLKEQSQGSFATRFIIGLVKESIRKKGVEEKKDLPADGVTLNFLAQGLPAGSARNKEKDRASKHLTSKLKQWSRKDLH